MPHPEGTGESTTPSLIHSLHWQKTQYSQYILRLNTFESYLFWTFCIFKASFSQAFDCSHECIDVGAPMRVRELFWRCMSFVFCMKTLVPNCAHFVHSNNTNYCQAPQVLWWHGRWQKCAIGMQVIYKLTYLVRGFGFENVTWGNSTSVADMLELPSSPQLAQPPNLDLYLKIRKKCLLAQLGLNWNNANVAKRVRNNELIYYTQLGQDAN